VPRPRRLGEEKRAKGDENENRVIRELAMDYWFALLGAKRVIIPINFRK